MKIEYNEFIGIYKNVFPDGYCNHMIKEFDRLENSGAGSNRIQSERAHRHIKDDYQIGLDVKCHNAFHFDNRDVNDLFFEGLQQCYDDYSQKFSSITQAPIHATHMKMQRTPPGGGYHIFHSEHGPLHSSSRVLVYILYLNTLKPSDGGETEFLYQKLRVSPEENTMLLWPAAFTHTHRGNTVLGTENKYIITGWFYFR